MFEQEDLLRILRCPAFYAVLRTVPRRLTYGKGPIVTCQFSSKSNVWLHDASRGLTPSGAKIVPISDSIHPKSELGDSNGSF